MGPTYCCNLQTLDTLVINQSGQWTHSDVHLTGPRYPSGKLSRDPMTHSNAMAFYDQDLCLICLDVLFFCRMFLLVEYTLLYLTLFGTGYM